MMANLSAAIAKTLRYGALFNFPMTEAELRLYLIGEKVTTEPLPLGSFSQVWEYVTMRGSEDLARTRLRRDVSSRKKIVRAIKIANLLRFFPGVRMVGLTGSVAAHNASSRDDIDLLVVTAPGRIWLTRLLVLGILSLVGLKRPDRARGHFDNQFCFNMWLDDSPEGLTMTNRDLYTAYEVCLMKPLFGGDTYARFMTANDWRVKFLPNFNPDYGLQYIQDAQLIQDAGHVAQSLVELPTMHLLGWALEPLSRYLSKRRIEAKHARGYHTGVVINSAQLMFHPESPRSWILQQIAS